MSPSLLPPAVNLPAEHPPAGARDDQQGTSPTGLPASDRNPPAEVVRDLDSSRDSARRAHTPLVILGVGRVEPNTEHRDCATGYRFDFTQQVSVTQAGRVTYRWLRSDGASAPVEYLDFPAPGTRIANTSWQRSGEPGDELSGWEQIEILTPESLRGERISFSYTCPSPPD